MKKIFLLVLAVASAICSWAQTPAWQQELNRLDKEADQFYEQKRWKQLVANQQQFRKVIMAQPDSVRMKYMYDTDLDAIRQEPRFRACMERLAEWGDYKQILKDAKPYYSGLLPEGQTYRYIALMPYDKINSESSSINWSYTRVCDEKWFWQSPY